MSATTLPPRLRPASQHPLRRTAGERLRSLVRCDVSDPAWARPALLGLLALTAVAYVWNLTESGYANSFYAAAVQAGTKSWKAFFFGSLDSSNFITVDKPPAALWVMALSGRIFGFNSASMLVPEVLEGMLSVTLLYAAVKRWYGSAAGLLAGGLLAATPVAALMFRFNNPDALLVCLLVASAYCLVRALERASTRWLLAVGALLGFAFLTKMLQAFLVLPGFALVYAVAAPTTVRRRTLQLLAGGVAVLVSCGWWVAIVALWPASSRPMIDGSPDNNISNLIFGYNGLGRIFGASGPGGGGGGGNFSGSTGVLRLFNDLMGGQASWLLPASLLALVAGLWWTRRSPRTDRTRAGLMLWGGWLLVTAAVFSFSSGVIHTYYTVALTPAIAALVAIGTVLAWRERRQLAARGLMAAGVLLSAGWAIVLLRRTPSWEPWLVPLIAVTGIGAIAALLVAPKVGGKRVSQAAAVLAAVACLAGPVAYTLQTLSTAHTGSIPSAGPASTGSGTGGPGGFGGGGGTAGPGGLTRSGGTSPIGGVTSGASAAGGAAGVGGTSTDSALIKALEQDASKYRWVAATDGSQNAASLELSDNGDAVMAIGGFNNEGGHITLAQFKSYVNAGDIHYFIASGGMSSGGLGTAGGGFSGTGTGRGGFPGAGGNGGARAGTGKAGLAGLFGGGAGRGGSSGGTASGGPPSGGSSGTGGLPGGAGGTRGAGGAPGSGGYSDSAITKWVEANFKKVTIGGETVYDLTQRS